jgi:hypothetical protein
MAIDLGTLWSAAGVLAGLQLTAFSLRITREITVGSKGARTWLPLAELLNLLSLLITVLGVFIAPVLSIGGSALPCKGVRAGRIAASRISLCPCGPLRPVQPRRSVLGLLPEAGEDCSLRRCSRRNRLPRCCLRPLLGTGRYWPQPVRAGRLAKLYSLAFQQTAPLSKATIAVVRTFSTNSRPACGRPPAAAILGRQDPTAD